MTAHLGISVITPTMRKERILALLANFNRQSFTEKELIIVINKDELNIEDFPFMTRLNPKIRILKLREDVPLGTCLNEGIQRAQYPYIAKMDDDDYYGSQYLQEIMTTFESQPCEVVCKKSIFYYFQGSQELILRLPRIENRVVPRGAGATIAFRKSIFKQVTFSPLNTGSDTDFFRKCRQAELPIYATSCWHYLCIRAEDHKTHTWQISEEKLKASTRSCLISKMALVEACQSVEQVS